MSFPNLCTVQDVKGLYLDFPSALNGMAKNHIIRFTSDIYSDLHLTTQVTDPDKLEDMKWACAFKVLAYLESLGLIEGSSEDLVRMSDGDFMVMFQKFQKQNLGEMPTTFKNWYAYYMRKLLPRPPIGSKNNMPMYSGTGRGYW